jgi:hypothetical protein
LRLPPSSVVLGDARRDDIRDETELFGLFRGCLEKGARHMQRRPWKQGLARAAGTLVLCAVPAVALAWFTPSAFSALSALKPQTMATQRVQELSTQTAEANVLNQFTDTATASTTGLTPAQLNVILINEARNLSKAYTANWNALKAALATLTPGTNGYSIALNQLLLQNAVMVSFNSKYKVVFKAGSSSNLTALNTFLTTFQVNVTNAQTNLTIQISQQLQSGSVSTITPPTSF